MTMLDGFGAVLFDFDGTLVDVEVDWSLVRRDAAATLAADAGLAPEGGLGRMAQMAEDALGARGRELLARVLARHEGRAGMRPVPEGCELLRRAMAAVPVGVVSNNLRGTVLAGLRAVGVDPAALVVVGFEDVARSKPDPQGIRLALSRLAPFAGQALYVGDSETDRQAALAAGVAFRHIGQAARDNGE